MAVEVQITRVEVRDAFQSAAVEDGEPTVLELDQPSAPKLLKRAVRMDDGETEAFRKLALRQRQVQRNAAENTLCCSKYFQRKKLVALAADNIFKGKIRCAALHQIFEAETSVALRKTAKNAAQRSCLSFALILFLLIN